MKNRDFYLAVLEALATQGPCETSQLRQQFASDKRLPVQMEFTKRMKRLEGGKLILSSPKLLPGTGENGFFDKSVTHAITIAGKEMLSMLKNLAAAPFYVAHEIYTPSSNGHKSTLAVPKRAAPIVAHSHPGQRVLNYAATQNRVPAYPHP